MDHPVRIPYLLLLFWTLLPLARAGEEVRVLIDVSGSMKQTDPHNLRVPALKLLLELLPPDTRAGVWLFADDVEPLIPPAAVDDGWKRQAQQSSARIHADGRLTHVEKALIAVTREWRAKAADGNRHLILLTDGMVDVAGGADADAASRQRLLTRVLPELQRAKVHLYTIALSDQADHALLKQLAVATDGWNEVAASADQLHRSFLKIFKKAVPRDTLPLENNRFQVDTGVREFSLLVFRRPDSPPTELVKPSGQRWTFENHPESVRWHREANYDLITVADPMPGQWQLIARLDPDNQVMIVTDLKLQVEPLPNYLVSDESLTVAAELTDHDRRITRENFLRLVQFHLRRKDDESAQWPLSPAEDPGVFTATLEPPSQPGTYTFTLTAASKTFQRRWEQSVEVIANPVELDLSLPAQVGGEAVVRLIPDPHVIDLKSFRATAVPEDGRPISFVPIGEGHWEGRIPVGAEAVTVTLQAEARDHAGHPLPLAFKPLTLEVRAASPTEAEEPETVEEEDPEAELEEELLEEDSPPGWWRAAAIAGAGNLILALLGFLAWRWLAKQNEKRRQALLERLGE